MFIGRERELASLGRFFARVGTGDRPGRAILLRGRRRVGKSRLAEEFIARSGVPSFFYTAAQESLAEQLDRFTEDAAASDLPGAALFTELTTTTWDSALRLLAQAIPQDSPSIIVIDELPFMIAQDPYLEGKLQRLFDREFSRRPVLLILIGSDLSIMEAINQYDRPFYMRASEMVVNPLTPGDVAERLSLPAAEAIDAYLITGGLPMILDEWPVGATVWEYLDDALLDSTAALIVSGERAMAAEFPPEAQARVLLKAIGSGQRTFSSIVRASGGMPPTSVKRALQILLDKRMVTTELPVSTKPSKETRYHISDTHLRFWLSFVEPGTAEIDRGRGDLTLRRLKRSWSAWRGTAVEPVIRESLRRMDFQEETGAIGGYWTRTNDPEIDLVGADREPIARRITMLGSIKWLESRPFDQHDLSELIVHRSKMPGADTSTPLYVVSRSGCSAQGVTHITPEELLDVWR
jgi:AAA+ ATPase superfamily predicted ATPase